MKAFKILKHDCTQYIHVLDKQENYGYICAMLAVAFAGSQQSLKVLSQDLLIKHPDLNKSPVNMSDIVNILSGVDVNDTTKLSNLKYRTCIDIALLYSKELSRYNYSKSYNTIIEEISIIDSVAVQHNESKQLFLGPRPGEDRIVK